MNKYLFPLAEHVEGGVCSSIPTQRESNTANEWPASTVLLWQKLSCGVSTSNFIIGLIPTVSMLIDCIIPWFITKMVIYPQHWSCWPAPCCAMLFWSGKRTKVFIQKLPYQSWKWTDLIARTTSIIRMTVARKHPAVLQRVSSCWPRLALQSHIHSWWIPGTHYRRASNRGCIKTLLLQSRIRSNRQRTQCLPWSSEWKQCVLTMWLFFKIWSPKLRLRSLRSKEPTQTSQ